MSDEICGMDELGGTILLLYSFRKIAFTQVRLCWDDLDTTWHFPLFIYRFILLENCCNIQLS